MALITWVVAVLLSLFVGFIVLPRVRHLWARRREEDLETVLDASGLRRDGVVAVAFTANWCEYSRGFERAFRTWEAPDDVAKVKADISSESNPLWDTYAIKITPSIALFRDGAIVWRQNGRAGRGLGPRDLERLTRESVRLTTRTRRG